MGITSSTSLGPHYWSPSNIEMMQIGAQIATDRNILESEVTVYSNRIQLSSRDIC